MRDESFKNIQNVLPQTRTSISLFQKLSTLSTEVILQNTKRLRAEDARCTAVLIAYLAEIIARKSYLAEGFSGIFDFCMR